MKTSFVVEKIPRSITPEIIIMMGYPGSGKTTIAQEICNDPNYIHIKGDDYKSNTSKMIKASQELDDKIIALTARVADLE